MPERFELIHEDHNTVIRDIEHGLNVFFLASSGMGVTSSTEQLAKRVVDYLNSLPPTETLLYPFNK